jgi:hypothetical protein
MAGNTVLKQREQAKRRRAMKKLDDFGRVWNCETDIEDETSGWINATLDGKYNAPTDIPRKYMKKGDPTNVFRMVINFAQWKADWRERMTEWSARLTELAQSMYPNDFGMHLANPTPDLLRMAGPMPIPLEFIEAMEVGNKWALGIPKADGTFYPRPKWATDELWAKYQLLKQSFWTVSEQDGFGVPDPSKYADEEDESEQVR